MPPDHDFRPNESFETGKTEPNAYSALTEAPDNTRVTVDELRMLYVKTNYQWYYKSFEAFDRAGGLAPSFSFGAFFWGGGMDDIPAVICRGRDVGDIVAGLRFFCTL